MIDQTSNSESILLILLFCEQSKHGKLKVRILDDRLEHWMGVSAEGDNPFHQRTTLDVVTFWEEFAVKH